MSDQDGGRSRAAVDRDGRYDGIEGGATPSPFASIFFVVAFVAAVAAAAVGDSFGDLGHQLWALAGLTLGVGVLIVATVAPAE